MYNKQQTFVSYANDEDSDVILLLKGRYGRVMPAVQHVR